MLDNVLGIIILFLAVFLILLSLFIVKNWNKKYLVKELYVSKKYLSLFMTLIISVTIEFLAIYFLYHDWFSPLMVIVWELLSLFVFCIKATSCVYLKDEMLVKKICSIVKRYL